MQRGFDYLYILYFRVLTNMRSVRVVGHKRTYDNSTSLRGVTKSDFMIV
ncbi:hypothetical protein E5347_10675 [Clostridium sartagoforme]|uniref:GMP synthase C-terminal domain-containing protein n=1 Tax=Clostridium sartagoforme TaxID=84031 RepID=A0A4S2DJ27_9CLOT|nr:hypothetical protein E5347_10675 [Clostridium sartagoforme]